MYSSVWHVDSEYLVLLAVGWSISGGGFKCSMELFGGCLFLSCLLCLLCPLVWKTFRCVCFHILGYQSLASAKDAVT